MIGCLFACHAARGEYGGQGDAGVPALRCAVLQLLFLRAWEGELGIIGKAKGNMFSRQFLRNIFLAIIVGPVTAAWAIESSTPGANGGFGGVAPSNISSEEARTSSGEILNSATPDVIRDVLQYALSHDGKRYRRGGSSPEAGFDCSGFVRHVFEHVAGIELPHSANDLSKIGNQVSQAELLPGDLVFFRRTKKHIGHVGIYLGDNKFIHASSRRTGRVMVSDLNDRYWAKRYVLARHLDTL